MGQARQIVLEPKIYNTALQYWLVPELILLAIGIRECGCIQTDCCVGLGRRLSIILKTRLKTLCTMTIGISIARSTSYLVFGMLLSILGSYWKASNTILWQSVTTLWSRLRWQKQESLPSRTAAIGRCWKKRDLRRLTRSLRAFSTSSASWPETLDCGHCSRPLIEASSVGEQQRQLCDTREVPRDVAVIESSTLR